MVLGMLLAGCMLTVCIESAHDTNVSGFAVLQSDCRATKRTLSTNNIYLIFRFMANESVVLIGNYIYWWSIDKYLELLLDDIASRRHKTVP